jgi:hypothetical protein
MPDKQSAYRTFHSTETALAKVLDDIFTAVDSGNLSLLSLLDLSAAFDTVDHDIPLQRLHTSFGLSSTVHNWQCSSWHQRLVDVCHDMRCATRSVLGPILFCCTQPTSQVSSHVLTSTVTCITTIRCMVTVTALHDTTERCIEEVAGWMRRNRLQQNASKTEFLWCSSSRRQHQIDRTQFCVGADSVQPAAVVCDLGLFIYETLSIIDHSSILVRTSFGILRCMNVSHTNCAY